MTIDTVDGKGQISFLTQEECTSYSVKEIGSDAFTTTWKKMTDAGSADVSEGSITKAGTTLTCVNTRSFGNLEISKTLTSYNTSLKEVTFVFQVEAVNAKGKTVYSNVVSTTHSAAGTKKVVIEDLPEGATVTVTEIYGGASYEATGSKEVKVQIVGGDTVSAEFTNTYDDKLVPGYGVTNHFELDENNDWQWSQLKDNSVE